MCVSFFKDAIELIIQSFFSSPTENGSLHLVYMRSDRPPWGLTGSQHGKANLSLDVNVYIHNI